MGQAGVTAHLEELRAAARYNRARRDLYRAKVVGPRPTSAGRLEQLERACALSETRLRRAEESSRALPVPARAASSRPGEASGGDSTQVEST